MFACRPNTININTGSSAVSVQHFAVVPLVTGGSAVSVPHFAVVPLVDVKECGRQYHAIGVTLDPKKQLCAGSLGVDTCQVGDLCTFIY